MVGASYRGGPFRWGLVAIAALALALLAAACEYPGIERQLSEQVAAGAQPSIVQRKESGAGGGSSARTAPGAAGTKELGSLEKPLPAGDISITERDFYLEPEAIVVQPGKLTFVLTNAGRYTHDFRVKGEGIDERSQKIGIGRTNRFTLDLREGEYEMSCPLSNHADRGMTGKIVVKRPG